VVGRPMMHRTSEHASAFGPAYDSGQDCRMRTGPYAHARGSTSLSLESWISKGCLKSGSPRSARRRISRAPMHLSSRPPRLDSSLATAELYATNLLSSWLRGRNNGGNLVGSDALHVLRRNRLHQVIVGSPCTNRRIRIRRLFDG